MRGRGRQALGALLLVAAVLLFGVTAVGTAGASPGPYVGEVVAGGACTQQQAAAHARGTHDGAPYECRQDTGADGKPCWLWKRVIVAGEPTGRWSGGPATCKTCSPSPSVSPSRSASSSPSTPSSPSASSPAPSASTSTSPGPVVSTTPASSGGAGLPVTGPAVGLLVAGAVLLLLAGVALVRAGRRRRVA